MLGWLYMHAYIRVQPWLDTRGYLWSPNKCSHHTSTDRKVVPTKSTNKCSHQTSTDRQKIATRKDILTIYTNGTDPLSTDNVAKQPECYENNYSNKQTGQKGAIPTQS